MQNFTFSRSRLACLILLPGFVTAWIVLALTVRPPQTELDKIIEALFYSFLTYFLAVLVPGSEPTVISVTSSQNDRLIPGIDFPGLRRFVVSAFLLSVSIGIIVSFLHTNDILTRLLRWVRVTRRSSRASVWSDVFHDVTTFAIIEFTDGRRIRGWPRYFSDTPEEGSLFLEQAAWILDDGTPLEIDGPGILITNKYPIQTVAFMKGVRNNQ